VFKDLDGTRLDAYTNLPVGRIQESDLPALMLPSGNVLDLYGRVWTGRDDFQQDGERTVISAARWFTHGS
jgi:hypothetical protein